MGFEQVEQMRDPTYIRDMSGGVFYNQDRSAIPDNGGADGDRCMWLDRRLRRTPGFAKRYTSALNTGAIGLGGICFQNNSNTAVGVFGAKLYKDIDTTSPTDITGALTLSATEKASFVEFRQGGTKYVIGTQSGIAPFKWTGTGNGAVLAGSPPSCKWIEIYNRFVWLANAPGAEDKLYWSGLTDPESWDLVTRYFSFPQAIEQIVAYGGDLVVFMPDKIGKVSGFGSDSFAVTAEYVNSVGCVSGHTAKVCSVTINGQEKEVIVFLAKDGLYIYDGTPNPIKISYAIERRFTGTSSERLAQQYLSGSAGQYLHGRENYYVLSVPRVTSTENNLLYWVDLGKLQSVPGAEISAAFWPVVDVKASSFIRKVNSTDENDLYFLDYSGFTRKFTFSDFSEDGAGAIAFFYSKLYDLKQNFQIRECNVLGNYTGQHVVGLSLIGDTAGSSVTTLFSPVSDLLDTTFILDVSQLADVSFIFANVSTQTFGRFLQFRLIQDTTASPTPAAATFEIEGLDIYMKDLGLRSTYAA